MQCIRCGSKARRDGYTRLGGQRWCCSRCGRRFTPRSTSAFSHHCFPDDLIALAIRWYVRYRLSYADVAEWLAERGVAVNQSTIYRWVQRFVPHFAEAAPSHRVSVGGTGASMKRTVVLMAGGLTAIGRSIRMVRSWTPTLVSGATPLRRGLSLNVRSPRQTWVEKRTIYTRLCSNIGAVRAGLLNVLITDEDTAREMLYILNNEDITSDSGTRPV